MAALVLYTKPGCHLCDEAQEVVAIALAQMGVAVEVVSEDVSQDAQLMERYGLLIPVLANRDTGAELNWPFGPADVRRLLKK